MTKHQSDSLSGLITGVLIHAGLFAAVMLLLVFIAFITGSFGWFWAAFLGWGMVLVGQAVFVFVFKRADIRRKEQSRVALELAGNMQQQATAV